MSSSDDVGIVDASGGIWRWWGHHFSLLPCLLSIKLLITGGVRVRIERRVQGIEEGISSVPLPESVTSWTVEEGADVGEAPTKAEAEKNCSDAAQHQTEAHDWGRNREHQAPEGHNGKWDDDHSGDDGQLRGSSRGGSSFWEKEPNSDHDQKNNDGIHERLQGQRGMSDRTGWSVQTTENRRWSEEETTPRGRLWRIGGGYSL